MCYNFGGWQHRFGAAASVYPPHVHTKGRFTRMATLSGSLMGLVGRHHPTFCPHTPAGCDECLTLDEFAESAKGLSYEALLCWVFSCPPEDFPDTRPFHKWVGAEYRHMAGDVPEGPGSRIERYYLNALVEYGWRVATGLVVLS